MKTKLRASLLSSSAILGASLLSLISPVSAQEVSNLELQQQSLEITDPLNINGEGETDSMSQLRDVNQLRDVSPADWSYEALRSLVDRYGCIAGFPNQTYRGNQPLSRYEFAAGLNSCLEQIERLIISGTGVPGDDLETLDRLASEFGGEIANIGSRIDEIESTTASLEDGSFSTTTKLVGEVAFTLAQAFGEDVDSQVVFNDKVRLQLASSFTGKDKLFTRLTAGNIANSFQDEIGSREGRLAHDGPGGNNVVIDRLHYNFGALDGKVKVTAMAVLAAHHFYADVFNDGLNTGGGAKGALTRFAERNPIYRHSIARSSTGIGLRFKPADAFEVSAGYIAPNGSDPSEGSGVFNGTYSALAQLVFKPSDSIKIGGTYIKGYDSTGGTTLWGGTGTNLASTSLGTPVNSDTFGGQFQWDATPGISLRGWFGYTDIKSVDDDDVDKEVLTYAGALVFPDLGKEGNLGAIVVGAEPYVTKINGDDPDDDKVPLHVEAFYRYNLNKKISITPGVVWLTNVNQSDDTDDVFIGALRTTFSF